MWTICEDPAALLLVVGALRTVAEADGEPSSDQRAWIEEVARRHEGTASFEGELPSADEVARGLPSEDERRRLLRHMVIVALADARLSDAEIDRVEAWSRELGVEHPSVPTMRTFQRGRMRALSMQLMRRSFIASLFKAIWRHEGLGGIWRAVVAAARVPNRAKAARYQALEKLPEGTLGRALLDHCRRNEFAMPGEKKGTPEILLFHDLGHALTGHDTDGPGEVQMAGFEAGFMKGDDAYSIALFGMYAFGLGAPIIPDFQTTAGDFPVPAFVAAYRYGEHLDLDLRFWNPWPSMDQPLARVRAELGLPEPA